MNRSRGKTALHIVAAAAVAVVGIGVMAAPAGAAPNGSTTGSVSVSSGISLTALTPSFQITGVPGDVNVAAAAPITMRVTTNNVAGYNVTVAARSATFAGTGTNAATIDVGALEVQGSGTVNGAFQALSFGTPTQTFTKAAASAPAGDTVTNAYRMTIPFVAPDTYSVVLDYVATAL
jgi:hypothetical protein